MSPISFTPDAIISTAGAVFVGVIQVAAILYGIWRMQKASAERMEQSDKKAEQARREIAERDRQSRQEIAERDRRFWERIVERDRESERRHQELMASMNEKLDQGREQTQAVVQALETLIKQTAPPPREDTPLVILAVR